MENNKICQKCNIEMEFVSVVSPSLALMSCPKCNQLSTITDPDLVEKYKSVPVIHETKLVPYKQEINCYCGGNFKLLPEVLMTDPPKYQYICENCSNRITTEEKYPKIIYKEE